MKRRIAVVLSLLMAGSIMTVSNASESEQVEITFMNYWMQYTEQLEEIKALYEEQNPNIKINMEILGEDYNKVLQTRIATQEIPDIFMSSPYSNMDLYADASADMSESSLWELMDQETYAEAVSSDGKILGVPFMQQVYGILYNKDAFEKAGITVLPETLSEMEEVCEKLKAVGITPFAEGFKEKWITDQLTFFPLGANEDFIQKMKDWVDGNGSFADDPISGKIFDMLEQVKENCQENPFDTDHMTQCTLVALGEAAMMQQGDWATTNIMSVNPEANIGIMPMPISEDPADSHIYTAPSIITHIGKDTPHREEVEAFLEWLYTDPEVQDIVINDMKVIPVVEGLEPTSESPVLTEGAAYIAEGKGAGWGDYSLLPGMIDSITSPVERFLLGEMDREEAISEISQFIAEYEA